MSIREHTGPMGAIAFLWMIGQCQAKRGENQLINWTTFAKHMEIVKNAFRNNLDRYVQQSFLS